MRNSHTTAGQTEVSIDLAGCLVQVEASRAWFSRRVLPLSVEQLRWRPGPQRWSIAECLDHLNITLGFYLPKIDKTIQVGWRQRSTSQENGRYLQSEIEALRVVEPPVTVRHEAARSLYPAIAVDPDCLVDDFHQTRDRYVDLVRRAFGLDLPRIMIGEPLHPFLRTLGGTLAFIAAHDRRHMWQAEQVRHKPQFPRAVFAAQE